MVRNSLESPKRDLSPEQLELKEIKDAFKSGFSAASDLDEAGAIAEKIENDGHRIPALYQVTWAQKKIGLYERAIKTAELTGKDSFYFSTVLDVATAKRDKELLESTTEEAYKHGLENDYIFLGHLAKAQASFGLIDAARKTAEKITLNGERAFLDIAKAEAQAGGDPKPDIERAKGYLDKHKYTVDTISLKQQGFNQIAEVEKELGIDPTETLARASGVYEEPVFKNSGRSIPTASRGDLATGYLRTGDIEAAKEAIKDIGDPYYKAEALAKLGKIEKNPEHFSAAKELVPQISGGINQVHILRSIARREYEAGFDPKPTIEVMKNMLTDDRRDQQVIEEIAKIEADVGLFTDAERTAARLEDVNEYMKSGTIAYIAEAKMKHSKYKLDDLSKLGDNMLGELLHDRNPDLSQAIGYVCPDALEKTNLIGNLPPATVISLRLGAAKRFEQVPEGKIHAQRAAEGVDPESAMGEKRALARGLAENEFGVASNIIFAKLQEEKDPSSVIRYLKTLIEIENPKGRTLATRLFANTELAPRLREYLARKLIDEGHWDQKLAPYLSEKILQGESKASIDTILSALITRLGLNPDLTAYQVLEKPGLLQGTTLEDRIAEMQVMKEKFARMGREELLESFKQNIDSAKMYYLFYGGAYSYTLINDYSFDKFNKVLDEIQTLEVDEPTLQKFKESLLKAGNTAEESDSILESMRSGKFPHIASEDRVVSFRTDVEYGSNRELQLERLQSVWQRELLSLCLARSLKETPANVTESLELLEQNQTVQLDPAMERISKNLKMREKHDEKTIKALADACRRDLVQSARQRKDTVEIERLGTLAASEMICEYLKRRGGFDQIPAFDEWTSHLSEVLTELEKSAGSKQGVTTRSEDLELTFLDKGVDFMRALRFADSQTCCFTSKHYASGGAAKWISRLNRDPLSFVMDIKKKGSNEISGFVFGRMGINPETEKPAIMLNGVYAQNRSDVMAGNVLKIIEERFARTIKADSMVVASQYGGKLAGTPEGYAQTSKELNAIRALSSDGRLEKQVYDDVGKIANGPFRFSGYVKDIS